jgi:uncharacterized DUF497 family protein
MIDLILEWDPAKVRANEKKHGVPFVLAGLVFKDRNRVEEADEKHSLVEPRFRVLGAVEGIILAVTFTRRGKAIRIISARPASRKERREYRAGAV